MCDDNSVSTQIGGVLCPGCNGTMLRDRIDNTLTCRNTGCKFWKVKFNPPVIKLTLAEGEKCQAIKDPRFQLPR